MSSPQSKSYFRLTNQEFFYLEQWGAFLAGLACFIMAAWAAVHDYRASSSAHEAGVQPGAHPVLNWLLMIAVTLVGTVLTRFSFTGKARNRDDEACPPDIKRGDKDRAREDGGSNTLSVSPEGNR